MDIQTKYSNRYAAILEVLEGAPHNQTAAKYGMDKGHLSRLVKYARSYYVIRLRETRLEKEFWEKVENTLDNENEEVYGTG